MAINTPFTNILPNPSNAYSNSGQDLGNDTGPGFRDVKLSSEHKINNTRTNSGRLISRDLSGHKWNIDISYNPLTRDEFDPIYSFLLQSRGSMKPFFVSLPQYASPKNATFSASTAYRNSLSPVAATSAPGLTNMVVTAASYTTSSGTPSSGDIFTISDTDSNHTKAYRVTKVETPTDYTDDPGTNNLRVHFIPALQRQVSSSATLTFKNPLFRVVLKNDVQEESLNTQNLYSFSLKLEEAQK